MSTATSILMLLGGLIAILAGVGIIRLKTPYARFHAAGKASPIAFLVAAVGAGIELGAVGAAYLTIAGLAMVMTLPIGVHLLFRAVHRTQVDFEPEFDELTTVERAAEQSTTDEPESS